jgi:hypothetical protein
MKVDWTRVRPAEDLREPVRQEVRRSLIAGRLRNAHRPGGIGVQALAEAMDELGPEDADVFGDAVAEEDRGLEHFAPPLRAIAADAEAPAVFRALAMAGLGALEDQGSIGVLSKVLVDPALSRSAAVTLLSMRSEEAVRALVVALPATEGWAKADILLALLELSGPGLAELVLVESIKNLGEAQGAVAYPVAMRVGLEAALLGDFGEAGRQAAVELLSILLDEESTGSAAPGRPLLLVGELVECLLEGLGDRPPSFREVRVATAVMASGEAPSLDDDLQALVARVDVPTEVRAAIEAGRAGTAIALTRTFRNPEGASIIFDELVMKESAAPVARAQALRTAAELAEPRAAGIVRAALGHTNDLLRAAALDAARYLVPALGKEPLVAHIRAALATKKPLLSRASIELARVVVDPSLVPDLEAARDVFHAEDRPSRAALDEAIALARSAATTPN